MGQTVELESYLQDARSSLHISGYAVLNDWLSLQELHELREVFTDAVLARNTQAAQPVM